MNSAQVEPEQLNRRTHFHGIIVLVLLAIALGALYVPQWLSASVVSVSPADEGYRYVVDLDFWRRTSRERNVRTDFRFDLASNLSDLPLTVGKWQGLSIPETNREVQILLEPEQYVRRLYQNDDGHYMWLSLIGGRSSQPFHAPDICYDADGWQYEMGSRAFDLSFGGQIVSLWLDAERLLHDSNETDEHVVSYFYIFPDEHRALSDGIVLFKLTSNRIGNIDQSLDLHEDFVRQFFRQAL